MWERKKAAFHFPCWLNAVTVKTSSDPWSVAGTERFQLSISTYWLNYCLFKRSKSALCVVKLPRKLLKSQRRPGTPSLLEDFEGCREENTDKYKIKYKKCSTCRTGPSLTDEYRWWTHSNRWSQAEKGWSAERKQINHTLLYKHWKTWVLIYKDGPVVKGMET